MAGKNEIVYWAENEAEAVVVIAKLKEAGIEATMVRESYGAMNSLSFGILGEIGISVAGDAVERAEAVILSWDDDLEDDEDPEASEGKASVDL